MNGAGIVSRLAVVTAILVALLAVAATSASAQGTGTSSITIHNRICPTDQEIDDYFEDCHDNPQDANLEFTIDGPVAATAATDAEGDVTFSDLPAGTYEISGGVPGEFADTFVYCADANDPETVFVSTTDLVVTLDLPEDTDAVCDWYNTPLDLRGDTDDDEGTDGATVLPTTGIGMTASAGTLASSLGLAAAGGMAGLAFALRRRGAVGR